MKKEQYLHPELELTEFRPVDILTQSNPNPTPPPIDEGELGIDLGEDD